MIAKERLEELIQQGATIYQSYGDVCVVEHKLNSTRFKVDNHFLWKIIKNRSISKCGYRLEQLFETKEETEFALKYQNIKRTETLSLPTWEEMLGIKEFFFIDAKMKEVNISFRNDILIWTSANFGTYIFQKPATKENYLKACELCKKLFLGENL